MKSFYKKLILSFVVLLIFAMIIQAADGSLDTSFGTNGKSLIDFDGNPTQGQSDSDFGLDVAIQADGKILVSGETFITTTDSVLSATRLNSDGKVDPTFAVNGRFMLNTAVGIAERAYAIAAQPDGKIIIAGRTNNSPRNRVVIRLNSNGSFDNTFGTNGVFQTPTGITLIDEQEIAIQPDGKIIVVGSTRNGGLSSDAFSVMRLTTDGKLDVTFDNDGEAVTVFGTNDRAYGVKLQSDGKIVVSGSTNSNGAMAVARYMPNGTLDLSFDSDGKVTTAFPGATSLGQDLTIQPDGKIIVCGYARTFSPDGAFVRYNPDGSLDTTFSGDGMATFGTTSSEIFWDVHLKNGKIIAGGFRGLTDPSSVEDFMVVRFNLDGTPDTGFGTNGVIYTDFSVTRDDCLSSAFQPDGKLVLAGYSGIVNPFNPDFALVRYNFSNQKAPADFDGDGKSDVSIYRSVNGATSQWWVKRSSTNAIAAIEWGSSSDIPVSADFDGDQKSDIAVWRASVGVESKFYILNSQTNTVRIEPFGQLGDSPLVVGDYDGDGRADPAIYRSGIQSFFYYRGSLNNPNSNIYYVPWGTTSDKPAVGDFNGDGKTDFVVFRNGEWWILRNGLGIYEVRNWGISTDIPVQGDYDGDGQTDLAVFRPTDGFWYVVKSSNGSFINQQWGMNTDKLVPADYHGDGKIDFAVYRNGTWYILRSSSGSLASDNFGVSTDTPIPSTTIFQ